MAIFRAVVPIIQGYEDAGDFTITERLKTSAHANLVYYLCVGAIGLFGLLLLVVVQEYRFISHFLNSLCRLQSYVSLLLILHFVVPIILDCLSLNYVIFALIKRSTLVLQLDNSTCQVQQEGCSACF